jgi:hypothetical protein
MNPTTRTSIAPSPWLSEVQRDLASLGCNPEWPAESAAVPGTRARRSAACALRLLAELGLRPDRLLPSLEGGVSLIFTPPGRYAELELLDGGEVVATCSGAGRRVWPAGSDLGTTLRAISTFLGG